MNCFLCHAPVNDQSTRIAEIQAGNFVGQHGHAGGHGHRAAERRSVHLQPRCLRSDGSLKKDFVQIQDPTNDNCAQCHGEVHTATKSR